MEVAGVDWHRVESDQGICWELELLEQVELVVASQHSGVEEILAFVAWVEPVPS